MPAVRQGMAQAHLVKGHSVEIAKAPRRQGRAAAEQSPGYHRTDLDGRVKADRVSVARSHCKPADRACACGGGLAASQRAVGVERTGNDPAALAGGVQVAGGERERQIGDPVAVQLGTEPSAEISGNRMRFPEPDTMPV
jgi:hypothetical protein